MASDAAIKSAPSCERTPSNTSSPITRRSSSLRQRGRIEDILEGARCRKVKLGEGEEGDCSMPVARDREGGGDGEGERVDEESSIVRAGGGQRGYAGTDVTARKRPVVGGNTGDGNGSRTGGEEDAPEGEGWWAALLSKYGSIELENKGSVARDHLALERTFLAWLRTSLAFASIGIAITQLFRLNTTSSPSSSPSISQPDYTRLRQMGKPLGATFLGISILMLAVGFHRYFESQHWIIRGKFPASRGSVVLVAGVTLGLMVTSLVVVLAVEPGRFERR